MPGARGRGSVENVEPRGFDPVRTSANHDVDPLPSVWNKLAPRICELLIQPSTSPVGRALANLIGGEEDRGSRIAESVGTG